jgi:2-aminoadipate transaminase
MYRERRNTMLKALAEHFPPSTQVSWTTPKGGLFLWLRWPAGINSEEVLKAALAQNVAFVPGQAFFAPDVTGDETKRYARLNFSNAQPAQICEGIRRLARVFEQFAPGEYTDYDVVTAPDLVLPGVGMNSD